MGLIINLEGIYSEFSFDNPNCKIWSFLWNGNYMKLLSISKTNKSFAPTPAGWPGPKTKRVHLPTPQSQVRFASPIDFEKKYPLEVKQFAPEKVPGPNRKGKRLPVPSFFRGALLNFGCVNSQIFGWDYELTNTELRWQAWTFTWIAYKWRFHFEKKGYLKQFLGTIFWVLYPFSKILYHNPACGSLIVGHIWLFDWTFSVNSWGICGFTRQITHFFRRFIQEGNLKTAIIFTNLRKVKAL